MMKPDAKYNNKLPLMIMAVPDYERYQKLVEQYGIKLFFEAFVDLIYQNDRRLTPKNQPNSYNKYLEPIFEQAMSLVKD